MDSEKLEGLRYPTGRFTPPETYSPETRKTYITALKVLPGQLRQVTYNLTEKQLDLPYREEGWSSRQIVHHLADSHINSFSRFKFAMTEDNPTIKSYDQEAWVKGSDAKLPIDASLSILEGIHLRLVHLLENMSDADFKRTLGHPEWKEDLTLDKMTALYAWHGNHHLTQIAKLKERQGW